jgi:Icc-related predicted phosphoesterase
MRILTVSDKVEPVLYSPYIRERVGAIDLILACGDLPDYYLEYIVGVLDAPLFFVHGNHDKAAPQDDSIQACSSPTGLSWAANMHGRSLCHKGLLIAGLEGCRRYNPGAPFQYEEADVRWQTLMLGRYLLFNRLRYGRYLDVFITHAPPRGIQDAQDIPHQGFTAYLTLLRRYRPLLMIHGHQHIYNRNDASETDYYSTRVINTYGYRVLELSPSPARRAWELIRSSR